MRDYKEMAQSTIGKRLDEVLLPVNVNTRILDESSIISCEYEFDRINLLVKDNIVVDAYVG